MQNYIAIFRHGESDMGKLTEKWEQQASNTAEILRETFTQFKDINKLSFLSSESFRAMDTLIRFINNYATSYDSIDSSISITLNNVLSDRHRYFTENQASRKFVKPLIDIVEERTKAQSVVMVTHSTVFDIIWSPLTERLQNPRKIALPPEITEQQWKSLLQFAILEADFKS